MTALFIKPGKGVEPFFHLLKLKNPGQHSTNCPGFI